MSKHKILVDLDRTLAFYETWDGEVGPPIAPMLDRVKGWLQAGYDVAIFTPRVAALHLDDASGEDIKEAEGQWLKVKKWVREHVGLELEVTAVKDLSVVEIWDDRAVRVESNTGVSEVHDAHDQLDRAAVPAAALGDRTHWLVERYAEACEAAQLAEGYDEACDLLIEGQTAVADITHYDLQSVEPTKFDVSATAKPEGIVVRLSSVYRTLPVHDARTLAAQLLRAANEMEDRGVE